MKTSTLARSFIALCLLTGTSAYAKGGTPKEPAVIDALGQITTCTGAITKNGKIYHADLSVLADFNQYYCAQKSGSDGLMVFKGELDGTIIGRWDLEANEFVFHSNASASSDHDGHDCRSGSCAPNLYDFSKLTVHFDYQAKTDSLTAILSGPRLPTVRFSCVSDATAGRQCTDPDHE